MNKTPILYRLILRLTREGYKYTEYGLYGKETESSFMVQSDADIEYDERRKRRIPKDKINKVENLLNPLVTDKIFYGIYSRPSDIEENKKKLKIILYSDAVKLREQMMQMISHIEKIDTI